MSTSSTDSTPSLPYGVAIGDPVHLWRADAPPLSSTYSAPACWHGLVLAVRYGRAAWQADEDPRLVWLADLAVVDPTDGSVSLERDVPQVESHASMGGGASYGVGPSWHRECANA